MIEIIPAIDLIDGNCVRLSQGDYDRRSVYASTPVEMARRYADAGVKRIHIVDLDGAKAGAPQNLRVLEEVASLGTLAIEWGGGIKDTDAIRTVFDSGVSSAIIGSVAVKHPELMEKWLTAYGGSKVILGADLRNGKVAVNGWLDSSSLSADDLINHFRPFGLTEVITTEISCDGMLAGPATDLYLGLMERHPDMIFTVSGGISSMDDIEKLDHLGMKRVIVGKAIYEGRITTDQIASFIHNYQ